METANSAHFIGPSTIKRAIMANSSTNAPTYTGPLVMGWSPKYCGNWSRNWNSSGEMFRSLAFLVCARDLS